MKYGLKTCFVVIIVSDTDQNVERLQLENMQLADCREAVDESLEFTGRNFSVAYFRVVILL